MPETTIREVFDQEMAGIFYRLPMYAFTSTPPMPDPEERRQSLLRREGARFYALFEDREPVACAAITPLTQNVRGVLFPIYGVFDVVTHPNARRSGYARRILSHLFCQMREDRRPFTCLYPFRESFYERLGYVAFPHQRVARFSPQALLPLLKLPLEGQVDLLPSSEALDQYHQFLRALREQVQGMAIFDCEARPRLEKNSLWIAFARVKGETAGMMAYQLKGDGPTRFLMQVRHFLYLNATGKYLLLNWLARHADQAEQVELMNLAPYELPETWYPDLRVKSETFSIAPMGRVADVSAVAGLKTGSGGFSARVSDPACPWNEGIWRFASRRGKLTVAPAQSADCELTVQGLSAIVYGTHDPADFAYRGWGSVPDDVRRTIRTMFPPQMPFLHEYF